MQVFRFGVRSFFEGPLGVWMWEGGLGGGLAFRQSLPVHKPLVTLSIETAPVLCNYLHVIRIT